MAKKNQPNPSKRTRHLPCPVDTPAQSLSGESVELRIPEIRRQRRCNPYTAERSNSTNINFWNKSQENLFKQIYGSMEVFEHRFVDWSRIANPEICAYDVSDKYKNLGLQDLASLNKDWVWNEGFVRQFYATVYIDPGRTKMEFMIGGRRHCVTKQDLENALSIKPRASSTVLHKSDPLSPTDACSLYKPNTNLYKPNTKNARRDLKDEVSLILKINEHSIFPRSGNRSGCITIPLKLAHAIYHQKHFDIGHFLLSEMCAAIETPTYKLPYAPHIIRFLRHLQLIPMDSDLPFFLKEYSPQLPKPNAQTQAAVAQHEIPDGQDAQAQVVAQQEIPDGQDVDTNIAQQKISDGQAQATFAQHEIPGGLAGIDQVHSRYQQPQPNCIDSPVSSIVQLSSKVDKLSDKVDKGFEALNDRFSHLSSEFDEMKAQYMENHGLHYFYERKRPKVTGVKGTCAVADP